jgi:hypothetical protein
MKPQWPRLTMLGRSVTLITGLILFNAGCWVAAAFLFRGHAGGDANGIMGLAMLAWVGISSIIVSDSYLSCIFSVFLTANLFRWQTIGLRHGEGRSKYIHYTGNLT